MNASVLPQQQLVPAGVLRRVERLVAALDRAVERIVRPHFGQPGTRRDGEGDLGDLFKYRQGNLPPDGLCQPLIILAIDQHDELLSALPGGEYVLLLQALGNRDQDLVAGIVAEHVIDAFEMIAIDDRQRGRARMGGIAKAQREPASVGYLSQRIGSDRDPRFADVGPSFVAFALDREIAVDDAASSDHEIDQHRKQRGHRPIGNGRAGTQLIRKD